MQRYFSLMAVLALLWGTSAHSQQVIPSIQGPDSSVLYKAFESDGALKHIDSLLVASVNRKIYPEMHSALWDSLSPSFGTEVVRQRMRQLDARSPLKLTYNPAVQGFINLYLERRREQMARMLGEQDLYFPMFEDALERHGLPMELKYLAIVESALKPDALSRAGARGLWQFMPSTGKQYGLEIDSYVDERCDPAQSTEAACRFLKDLYSIFGDWNLALAAYNSGPGNVRKAIRKSGGQMDFWAISPYLPAETRGYVPAFIAVNYAMSHAADYRIHPVKPPFNHPSVEAVALDHPMSFEQLAALLSTSVDALDYLNPVYKKNFIPGTEAKPLPVRLPIVQAGIFHSFQDSIKSLALIANQRELEAERASGERKKEESEIRYVTHKVRRGESLGRIAAKYDVSVSQIKDWNNLRSNTIHTGQRLTVKTLEPKGQRPTTVAENKPVESSNTDTLAASKSANSVPDSEPDPEKNEADEKLVEVGPSKSAPSVVYYKVQPGDTLYSIARQYPGISAGNIMEWNKIQNAKSLKAGTKLKILVKS